MFNFIKNLFEQEENLSKNVILKTSGNKVLVDAIVNRHPITFYYSGPRKPSKESVKPGYRIKGEPVALGVSKKGNLIIRIFVQPPSVSKKGFEKHGWRTFLISRMSRITVHKDETFNTTRPLYNGGGDDNVMRVTYVSTDFSKDLKKIPSKKLTKTKQVTKTPEKKIEAPKKQKPKPLAPKQVVTFDNDIKNVEDELSKIEKNIKTSLDNYKKTKGTPDEIKHINDLKKYNEEKKNAIKKMDDIVANISKDTTNDNSEINKIVNKISKKKSEINLTQPIPTKKPDKTPDKTIAPEKVKSALPQPKVKEKPKEKPNINEDIKNRIKKLITYF